VYSINVETEPLQESCNQSSAPIITSGNSIYVGRVRAVAHSDISILCTTWATNLKAQMYLVSIVTHFQSSQITTQSIKNIHCLQSSFP